MILTCRVWIEGYFFTEADVEVLPIGDGRLRLYNRTPIGKVMVELTNGDLIAMLEVCNGKKENQRISEKRGGDCQTSRDFTGKGTKDSCCGNSQGQPSS